MTVQFRRAVFVGGLACATAAACSSGGLGVLDGGDVFGTTDGAPDPDATSIAARDGSAASDATRDGTITTDGAINDSGKDGAAVDAGFDASTSCNDAATYPDGAPGAAAFTIDSLSYGSGGFTSLNFTVPGSTYGSALARQADGKLLLGIEVGWNRDTVGVARFLATGAIDTSFGTNGVTFVPIGRGTKLTAVLLQSTGKIVVVGNANFFTNKSHSWMVRLTSSGAIDATFGTAGTVMVNGTFGGASLQTDDSILVTAYMINMFVPTAGRFQPNGALDTTFGNGGYATKSGLANTGHIIFQQADGKILVGENYPRQMARLTAAGAVDTSFGDGGAIIDSRNDAGASNSLYGFAQQADGKILAAGRELDALGIQRLSATGAPDPTFGDDAGWATFPSDAGPLNGFAGAATVQADGKIVAAGAVGVFQNGAARFNTDGGVDTTYGAAGFGAVPVNAFGEVAAMVPVAGAGGVALGGDQLNYTSNIWEGAIAMLSSTGAVVPTFGDGGLATLAAGASHDEALGLAVQADGKAIVVGSVGPDRQFDFGGVARLTTAGAVDTSFAGTGRVMIPQAATPTSVVIESSGRIVVGAVAPSSGSSLSAPGFTMRAFTSSGAVDSTFGADGGVLAPAFSGRSIALGPFDHIAAVGELPGSISSSTGSGFVVSAFGADGRPSSGWGADAGPDAAAVTVKTLASAFGATSAGASAAAVQSDGKIVAVGYAGQSLALARYLSSGALDATFGTGGVVTTDVSAALWLAGSFRVVVQADGSLVVAGLRGRYDASGQTQDLVLARYGAGGQLDCAFAAGGIAIVPLGPIESFGYGTALPVGLALAGDGRIFVATTTSPDAITESVLLLRFTTAGFVDARSVVHLGTGLELGHAVAVQGDGKVLVAGRTWTQSGLEDFFVARFAPPP